MRGIKLLQKIRYGVNLNKPRYMYSLASNVFKRRLGLAYPLRGVDFAIDYACNLKCSHCFNHSLEEKKRKMSIPDYVRVISEASDLGAINFAFQGGEILVYPEFEKILKLVDVTRYSLSITTNGYLLDDQMIARLKSLGVNTITISLDSGISDEHDKFRGKVGAFERAVRGIDLALRAGLKVVVNSCIDPTSIRSQGFKELLGLVRSRGILINTIFAAPSGRWSNNQEILLSEDDIAYYSQIVETHPYVVRDMDSGYAQRGCQGGTESLYVTPFGDVLPCPYIHIRAGNIFEESLESIRARAMKYFRYQKKCMISENRAFIDEYIALTSGDNELPLSEIALDHIKSWGGS